MTLACKTYLLCRSAFTAALVANEHFKFHVQNSLAVAKAAALAIDCGESTLDQNVKINCDAKTIC